ncbi:unnamed protein product [marine sediment metagenome]|uniref:Peptide deformylase n=1 Tax=marine sediment metagenome TaxID=412755 RepID=X1SJX9_9ZZZZ
MNIVTSERLLRKPTGLVKETDDVKQVVEDLFREMEEREALGMAANQLGYSCRVFVMRVEPLPPICIVNPVVAKQKGSQLVTEYCESLPGEGVVIKRPYVVVVKGVNQYFRPVRYRLSGLQARIACHEIDHLLGKLIVDYKERE